MRFTHHLKQPVLILCCVILLVAGCGEKTSKKIVGGDKDKFGCIYSAGYQWCANENRCVRPWEIAQEKALENTKEVFNDLCNGANDPKEASKRNNRVGNDRDEFSCITSAGYQWCESLNTCVRPWELAKQQGFNNTPENIKAYCHKK